MTWTLHILNMILLSTAIFGQPNNNVDPCTPDNHQVSSETSRSTGYDTRTSDTPMCDNKIKKGWHRFTGLNGRVVEVPTTCPGTDTCGTTTPIWMDGPHPTIEENIVTRKLCGKVNRADPNADCCEFKDEVFVKNCGNFYVYYLGQQHNCPIAYCAGSAKRCPVGKWSPTNFEPCQDPGLILEKPPKVSGPNVHRDKSFDFKCDIEYDPTNLGGVFEVVWTKNGKPDPSMTAVILTGAQRSAKLIGDQLTNYIDTEIGCQVTTYFTGQEKVKNTYQSNALFFGVKTVELTGPSIQKTASFIFLCKVTLAPTDPDQKIEVVWTFNGVQDPKIKPGILVGKRRKVTLRGNLLAGHLSSNVGCEARLVYDRSNLKTNYRKSNNYFAGLQVIPEKLAISGSEGEKDITVISTIPLVCENDQICCLTFNLNIDKNAVVSLKSSCEYKICNSDWDPVKKQASVTITVVPSRNAIAAGTRDAILSFQEIVISGTGSYIDIFKSIKPNPVPIVITLEGGFQCSITGDPHFTGFDNKHAYHLFQVGDYTVAEANYRDFKIQIRTWPCFTTATCVCGVVIKEKNDIIRVYGCDKPGNLGASTVNNPYPLSPGTVVQRSGDGYHIGVLLPSGSEIKIDIDNLYMNVYIQIPAYDSGKVAGICGTGDRNPANDFTHPDGTVTPNCGDGYCIPVVFIESWGVTGKASMLEITPEKIPDKPSTDFCSCTLNAQGKSEFKCSPRQHIQDTQLACQNCQVITKDMDPITWNKPAPHDPPKLKSVDPNKTWPNDNGVTEVQANDLCNKAIQKSPLYTKCKDVDNLVSSVMSECLADVLFGGTTEAMDAVTSSYTSKCQFNLAEDVKNYVPGPDGTLKLNPDFNELVCPLECLDHGKCGQGGKCECNNGWKGDTCQIDAVKGPQITFVPGRQGCLTRQKPCDTLEFDKSNVNIHDTLKCKLQPVNEQGAEIGQPVIVDALGKGSAIVICPLEKKVKRRDVSEPPIKRYKVSVSSDGDIYGNVLLVIALDSSSVECNETECTIKEHSTLPESNVTDENVRDVAFTAVLRVGMTTANGEIVVYPNVYTNEGNGYNSSTGIFTAPKGGIYVFNFHGLSSIGNGFWLQLYKNDQFLISAYGSQNGNYASGGNTITLKLIEGDTVYMKTSRTSYLYGTPSDVYASFTGYLLGTSSH